MRAHAVAEKRSDSVGRAWAVSTRLLAACFCLLHLSGPLPLPPGIATVAAASLEVRVNYAHNWVDGTTDPGATVGVEVRDGNGGLKGETTVSADGGGYFIAGCGEYPPEQCPNLIPGDTVIVSAAGLEHRVEPVGWIEGMPYEAENTVAGTLDAGWFTGPLTVRCEVWEPMGPPPIATTAATDGGTFSCDFDDVAWDLQRGQMIALSYDEPDGDTVVNIVVWPWFRVNSGHDWVGGNYPAGHAVTVTVFEPGADTCGELGGTVKAVAQLQTDWDAGWGEDGLQSEPWHWSPGVPDIVPGDDIEFVIQGDGHGFCQGLSVGEIAASVDVASDTVSGTIDASWIAWPVDFECHPWGAGFPVPIKMGTVQPDGVATFTCDWSGEWDILPGQEIGVMYIEPEMPNRIIEVVHEPAPRLTVGTEAQGAPAAGGNLAFTIHYHNAGDAAAEDVTITDAMELVLGETPVPGGMSYLSDTSGLSRTGSGSGPIVWDVGTVAPGDFVEFEVYVEITASVDDVVRNTVHIETSSYDSGPPEEKTAVWEAVVLANDTHLDVGKHAWTPDPAPDGSVVFSVTVCNRGQTGSTELTLTDTMGTGLALDSWWATHAGWSEVSSGPGSMTVAAPSIPGNACREVLIRATVDPGVAPDDPLSNLAVISAANDMETADNQSSWEGSAAAPHLNLWVGTWWGRGVLVPGGEVFYTIAYGNGGNQPAAQVRIVDTLPPGTSFVGSWHGGPLGDFEIFPIIIAPGLVVWELPEVPNGVSGHLEVHLSVDPALIAGSVLTNTVEICGPAVPPEPCDPFPGEDTYEDNTSSWTELLYPPGPNLRIRKRGDWISPEAIRYTVRFENIGDDTVSDVAIVDTLPAGTFWDGWWMPMFPGEWLASDIFHDNGVLTWNLHELQPAAAGELAFNAVLDGTQEPLQWLENTIEITLPVGDTNAADNFFTNAMLWIDPQAVVFFDGFESGTTSAWSSVTP